MLKLYVSTQYDRSSFLELQDEYWLPDGGRLAFQANADAARDQYLSVTGEDATTIPLWWVGLHTKTSYFRFYEKQPEGFTEPPARPSFERPSLVLYEHEREDLAIRDGSGFTVFSAAVCLPNSIRQNIAAELKSKSIDRTIVIGFAVAPFGLPLSRAIEPNSSFDERTFVFEVEEIEVRVF